MTIYKRFESNQPYLRNYVACICSARGVFVLVLIAGAYVLIVEIAIRVQSVSSVSGVAG